MTRLLAILALFVSSSAFCQQIHSTVIANYPFSGNANDISGFNNHGTIQGALPATDRFGNANSAFYFNGSSQITLPDSLLGRYTSLSVSLWFNTTSKGVLIGNQHYAFPNFNNHYVAPLYIGDDGLLRGKWWNGNRNNHASQNRVDDGNWHHAMLIARTDTQWLFLDYVLVGTYVGYIDQLDMNNSQIGNGWIEAWPGTNGQQWYPFQGIIDDVTIRVDSVKGDTIDPTKTFLSSNQFEIQIRLFPNPARDVIRLSKSADVQIYNTIGDLVLERRQSLSINVSELTPGMYVAVLIDPKTDQLSRQKIQIE